MTEQDLESLLDRGHETNGMEFKGPGKRSDAVFLAKVVRAIIGMANRRDGGVVIIGVDSDTLEPVGLDDDQLNTWDYDDLATSVNTYASPSVTFDLTQMEKNGERLVVIEVHEFSDIPILCRKDYQPTNVKGAAQILRNGACYVRSRHKPETAEIPSEEEMRELLELAIDKGVRRFIAMAQKAGLFGLAAQVPAPPSDEERYKKQIEELG